jgi:hypothetical protein
MMLNVNCPAHCKWRRLPGLTPVMLVLISVVILISSALLLAQSTVGTGSIQGVVSDPTSAVLSGAKITITNKATAGVIRTTTSFTGTYTSGPMVPGDYKVRVEAKGFQTAEFSVTAQVSVVSSGSVHLQPGQESPARPAPEAELSVNIDQPTVQAVLEGNPIEGLPINGRNFMDLAQLEPGIQFQDGSVFQTKNGQSTISFHSQYGRGSRFEVDGVDISDETEGATTQNIPASAIQEFNLSQSSLDLSTELTSTGTVNVITRSGSDALHGEGFGSFVGNQTSAVLPGRLPGNKPSTFQREQFGGRAGGSIIPDKVFWFVDGEGIIQDQTIAEPFSFPFNALNAGLAQPFRATQVDSKFDWQVHDNAHAFLRFNFDQNNDVRPYGSASSLQAFKNQNHTPSLTLGYDFSTGVYNHSVRFEYLKFRNNIGDSTGAIPMGVDNPIPGLGINIGASVGGSCLSSGGGAYCGGPNFLAPQATEQSDYEFKYDGSRVFGRHIVRYGATWNHIQAAFGGSATYPQVGTTSICLIPGETAFDCTSSADPTAYPAQFVQLGNGIGFSTPQHAFGQPGGGVGPDNRLEAYVGDSWKFRKTLTLTYGLHYVLDTGRVDSNMGAEPTLNLWGPGLGNKVRTPGTNFAPMAGFAWDPAGSGKTVIRAGAGLYFENSLWNYLLHDNPVRQKTGVFSYTPEVCSYGGPTSFTWPTSPGTVGSPVAGGAGVVVAGTDQVQPTFCGGAISSVASDILALSSAFQTAAASLSAQANSGQPNGNFIGTSLSAANANGFDVFDPNYRTARSYQMNLGFQQEFGKGTVFSVDYIRSIGEHFLIAVDRNHSGAARSYNLANAQADRDAAQLANGCLPGFDQANCMVLKLGQAGAQAAYSAAGLDSNNEVTGGGPCPTCAFPGITPNGINNTGNGSGNGALGTLDMFEPVGRSVYSGFQFKLVENVLKPWPGVKAAHFQIAYSLSKFVSQAQDQDFINLATNNDNAVQFTGPNALDRKHQVSFGGSFDLPFFTRISLIGHFYSPLPQNLQLPEMTNGGEIFATDWLGSGLGSGAAPEPLPGTQLGQFMRSTDTSNLHTAISNYNTHFAGQLTPAGQCLVGGQSCPGTGPIPVMTQSDMNALGWVMPQIATAPPDAQNFPWLKSLDLKAAWPLKLKVWEQSITVEPSASIFNVFNFANSFQPGNLPLASLLPGGPNGTLAPNAVGGVTGAYLTPFRAGMQSGTYALGAPRQIEFGLRISF